MHNHLKISIDSKHLIFTIQEKEERKKEEKNFLFTRF